MKVLTDNEYKDLTTLKMLPSHLLDDVRHVNIMLTNRCNLHCRYCYEQHETDNQKWTVESLRHVMAWLNTNLTVNRSFQFFGGEPLLQSRLILDFMEASQDLIHPSSSAAVKLVTNGTKLTQDFIDKFRALGGANIIVSLDSHLASYDTRGVTQEQINSILSVIKQSQAVSDLISIRCTISPTNVENLYEYLSTLHNIGIKRVTVHPLLHSRTDGIIEWEDDKWALLNTHITHAMNQFKDLIVNFTEGVGADTNCILGKQMIAIDSTGDYSGCYFVNNLKPATESMVLGNVFTGEVYVDRYTAFDESYKEFKEQNCGDCDLRGLCYQCPAGNISTVGVPYHRSSMCQKVVALYNKLLDDRNMKLMQEKLRVLTAYQEEVGENHCFSKVMMNLLIYRLTGQIPSYDVMVYMDSHLPSLENICGAFSQFGGDKILPVHNIQSYANLVGKISGFKPASFQDCCNWIYQTYDVVEPTSADWPLVHLTYLHAVIMNRYA